MKNWLLSLSQRDRLALIILSTFLMITGLFLFVVSPLKANYKALKEDVSYHTSLLSFMMDAQIKLKNVKTENAKKESLPLLQAISKSLETEGLSTYKPQISQGNSNNKASVNFKTVPFPYLIKWLTTLSRSFNIHVEIANLTPSSTPGIVKAELSLIN